MSVLVALSGGVDSSVAAALLVEAGESVVAVTLRLRPCEDDAGGRSCCAVDAVASARAVAGRLGLPHYVVDARAELERLVLLPAWGELALGRTPNPCIACNRELKLGLLRDLGARLGADRVATGHYARVVAGALHRAADRAKDQSYFLHALAPEALAAAVFPLGDLSKTEVRRRAAARGLETAERRDSQDACLAGPRGFAEELRRRAGAAAVPGELVWAGRVVGHHDGVHRFTIGQSRGLGVAAGRRLFVAAVEPGGRVLLAERPPRSAGLVARLVLPAALPGRAEVQIRSRGPAHPAAITVCGDLVTARFDEPATAVTPGQSAVFYAGDRVLGGGPILEALDEGEPPGAPDDH